MKEKRPPTRYDTWGPQFMAGLRRSVKRFDGAYTTSSTLWLGSLDEHAAAAPAVARARRDKPYEQEDLLAVGLRAILHQQVGPIFGALETVWLQSESPIERAMLLALAIAGGRLANRVVFRLSGIAHGLSWQGESPQDIETLWIEQQAQIGKFRVDFLLTLECIGFREIRPKEGKAGGPTREGTRAERRCVVECDGHDYHERTKEQARTDRQRDRALQTAGYKVFRYTGSEIWADVFACAFEVLKPMHEEVEKEAWGD